MPEQSIAQLMTWNIVTVNHDSSLVRAAEIMETARISSVLVMELGKPVGIITERDILKALGAMIPPEQAVATVMGRPLVSARQNLALHDAYHLMAERGVRHLLVTDKDDHPAGIVSESDFRFHLGLEFYRRLHDVRTVMSARMPVLPPTALLREAVAAMAARDANCAVVAVDGAPVGMVTERDTVRFYGRGKGMLELPLAEVMSSPVTTISVGTPLHDAMELMQSRHIRHLVVVTDDGQVAGILSEHDVVRQLESEYLDFALRESRRTRQQLQDSEMRRRAVFNQASEYMGILDLDGTLRDINNSSLALLGKYGLEDVIGKPFWNTPWWSHDAALQARLRQAFADLASGHSSRFEATHPAADGSLHFVDFHLHPILDETGKLTMALAEGSDITERKRAEQELRIAATAFEAQEGMLVTDANNVILRVNRAFTEITGYSADEAVGRTPSMLKSGRHDAAFYAEMWASIGDQDRWQGEIWNRRKNGEVYPEWLTITVVKGDAGKITNYVATLTDITLRKAAADEIQHLAFYDPLTRLPNRRLLQDRLRLALASSARSKREGALLFIDLDNFKTLNDTLGHDIGDQLLQQVAQRLATCVREGDTVARLGGDEFVIMLDSLSENLEEAATQTKAVGEKILATLNQPYLFAGVERHSTPSIGATLFNGHQSSVDELLKRADLAMYQAKSEGRNTMRFFDPVMQAAVSARAELEADLRAGLKMNQFLLYFQPNVDETGRMTGAEALLRWQHPLRGLLSPADFIPLAEDTGLILPLGQWVLKTACAQLAAWSAQPETAQLTLSINVSARQFRHPDFVEQVLAALDRAGADPRMLKLELTECMLMDNVEGLIARMAALNAKGIGFALDDFGAHYSSLTNLKHLPLDQLKIDRSIVRDILTDAGDAAIAHAIVTLAQSLGLEVIAKGVETGEQREFLAQMSCNSFQGYLFGRPSPLQGFGLFLNQD